MSFLGSLQGTGRILVNGKHIGEAEYEITVFQEDTSQEAYGSLLGETKILQTAFESSAPELVLETGETIRFTITDWRVGTATIVIYSPVPGF
jgi:hypothetical protein